ncbi:MAG: hypothetical protein LBI92_00400 [Azoarcus sp.]|jgi:hypothetical protein|nr:hypothetical protein [Azoarcus sp.]
MKKTLAFALLAALSASAIAQQGDTYLSFQPIVAVAVTDGQLSGKVQFYLRGQKPPGNITETFPEAVYDKPAGTQVVNASVARGCATALRRVLASFEDYAKKYGANAVVDMVSFHGQEHHADNARFWCHEEPNGYVVKMRGKPAIIK